MTRRIKSVMIPGRLTLYWYFIGNVPVNLRSEGTLEGMAGLIRCDAGSPGAIVSVAKR